MANYVYAYATSEIDGSRAEAKFIGDQVGVRMFVRGAGGVEMVGEWRGARIVERRKVNGQRAVEFEIELEGVDADDFPFTLEHWGGCHCSNPLKRFRPPAWTPA